MFLCSCVTVTDCLLFVGFIFCNSLLPFVNKYFLFSFVLCQIFIFALFVLLVPASLYSPSYNESSVLFCHGSILFYIIKNIKRIFPNHSCRKTKSGLKQVTGHGIPGKSQQIKSDCGYFIKTLLQPVPLFCQSTTG